jgi:tetratricopeptide (TPR) repeat protein
VVCNGTVWGRVVTLYMVRGVYVLISTRGLQNLIMNSFVRKISIGWSGLIPVLLSASCLSVWAQTSVAPLSPNPGSPSQSARADTDFAEARRLMQQGRYDEAISQLSDLAVKNPAMKGLSFELGTAYYRKADYIKAIDPFKRAVTEDPENKEAIQLLGLSYYLSGRPAEAIPQLEKAQSWYPRANVDASYILGLCYIQTKDYPQARKSFARMFEVPPDSAASYLLTARMLLRQEFDPIAEEYAQKAIALDPKLPLSHFFLGELHLYKSRVPEAIADFQKELAINPGHAPTYYKLADAYSRVQKYDDAERLLQRSIWLDATSTGPYILMGKVLQKKGEAELAVRALQHALGMDPNNSVTHHLLGQAYRDMGRNEDAERELQIAQQLQESSGKQ